MLHAQSECSGHIAPFVIPKFCNRRDGQGLDDGRCEIKEDRGGDADVKNETRVGTLG